MHMFGSAVDTGIHCIYQYIPVGVSCYLGADNVRLVVAAGAGGGGRTTSLLCEELTGSCG